MPDESIEAKIYWLALSRIKNLGVKKAQLLLSRFGSVEAIFSASTSELESLTKLSSTMVQDIINSGKDIAKYENLIGNLSNSGIDVLCPDDLEYPNLLNFAGDPPIILYKRGVLPKSDYMTVAIVGTRFPTREGSMKAQEIAERLAKKDIVVVSGLAKGIDTSAHKGALNCGGKTISVVGSGLRKIYPNENSGLAESISNNGCILSECHPNEIVSKGRLIQRNRIISGISLGVILVEPERGAMNTAYWASMQNRPVFLFDSGNSQEPEKPIEGLLRIVNIDWLDILIAQLSSFKDSLSLANMEDHLELF